MRPFFLQFALQPQFISAGFILFHYSILPPFQFLVFLHPNRLGSKSRLIKIVSNSNDFIKQFNDFNSKSSYFKKKLMYVKKQCTDFILICINIKKKSINIFSISININKILMDMELILNELVFESLDFETILNDQVLLPGKVHRKGVVIQPKVGIPIN